MTMKRIYALLILFATVFGFVGCSDDDRCEPAAFVSYSIRGYQEKAVIDARQRTVFLRLPDTVKSGANLCPEFEVTPGTVVTMNLEEQKSGAETLDFGDMQLYTLTSGDGKSDRWHVTVTNNDYTASYGLGNFLTYSCSNNGRGDFYRQQQHTGEHSGENCGPACAVMAALFVDPSYAGTVEEARQERPTNGDGGILWYDNTISGYLYDHGFSCFWRNFGEFDIRTPMEEVLLQLRWGAIAVCCLDIYQVREQVFQDRGYRADKYYHTANSGSGHFIIVKGYRVVSDEVWFEVHDPWGLDMVYADGTPMGANRFYRASEVLESTLAWNRNWVLFVNPWDKQ